MSADTVEVKNVILRVAVAVSVGLDDGNVMREATYTQLVNAHGGLLTLRMELVSDQKFMLSNPKTEMARRCSVVRTEKVCQ